MEIAESNEQFLGAFSALARGAAKGDIAEFGGIVAMYSRVPVFVLNAIGFRGAITDREDLEQRVHTARSYADAAGFPYFLCVCHDLVPPGVREEMDHVAAQRGLVPIMGWTGMAADALAPVSRTATDLELRPVADSATRLAVSDVNSLAYGMPAEPGRDAFDREPLWQEMWGEVGYVGDEAVATATAMAVDGRLYMAMVATHPEHRRKGYAEACMRRALARATDATGFTRTILHATAMGHPLYLRMGYRDVTQFTIYAEAAEEH